MIFRPELAEKVLRGEKTVTRRLLSDNPRSPWWREGCAYRPGRDYAVQPGRGKPTVGRLVIVRCAVVQLGWLTRGEAAAEGFASPADFARAWVEINDGGYDGHTLVWRVQFELVAQTG